MQHSILPELIISGTLLGPLHVLLTAVTSTVYCSPHCKLVIIQLELSVMHLSVVPFAATAVAL